MFITTLYSPPYFLFTKKYWASWGKSKPDEGAAIREMRKSSGGKKKKVKRERKRTLDNVMDDYSGDISVSTNTSATAVKKEKNSVKNEKKKVKTAEKEGVVCDGLRVIGIRKTYFKKAFERKSKDDVHAVRGVHLEVPDRELLCLLGHNGAGKSTLLAAVSMLAMKCWLDLIF